MAGRRLPVHGSSRRARRLSSSGPQAPFASAPQSARGPPGSLHPRDSRSRGRLRLPSPLRRSRSRAGPCLGCHSEARSAQVTRQNCLRRKIPPAVLTLRVSGKARTAITTYASKEAAPGFRADFFKQIPPDFALAGSRCISERIGLSPPLHTTHTGGIHHGSYRNR